MVPDNILCHCLLDRSLHAVHMIKALIALCVLRAFVRKRRMKFISQLHCIFHDIFGITRMNALPCDSQDCARRVEALITQISQHTAVHRIGILRAKILDIKIFDAVSNLFVRRKANTDLPVLYLGMRKQIRRHRHNLCDARLVVPAKQRIAVCHDQLLSLAVLEHWKL